MQAGDAYFCLKEMSGCLYVEEREENALVS